MKFICSVSQEECQCEGGKCWFRNRPRPYDLRKQEKHARLEKALDEVAAAVCLRDWGIYTEKDFDDAVSKIARDALDLPDIGEYMLSLREDSPK